ncbi:MAG: hypothetical protein NBV63_03215, partial [Candidatus Pacebacteria bacterium]|nr:hypothetical protein [Candidatus Paceibacterota bacterium]
MADTDEKVSSDPNEPQLIEAEVRARAAARDAQLSHDIPRLRTFADDLSEEIKKKGTTVASIVQQERERAAREIALDDDPKPKTSPFQNSALLIGTLALIIVGGLALGGAYVYSIINTEVTIVAEPTIIFPNKTRVIDVPNFRSLSDTLLVERTGADLALGEVLHVRPAFIQATTSPEVVLAQFNAPAGLLREARSVMVGVHSFDRNQPFIIIEITQYDRAYGAMLGWEEDMARGLGNFFKPKDGTIPPTLAFTDKVIQNIDVRVSQPEWPIMYAFPRRDVLVITTNQYTLFEVVTRLSAQGNPVR